MKSIDLLFIQDNLKQHTGLNNDYLEDIEFSCFESILDKDEYKIFSMLMAKPLNDEEKIKMRQDIFKDLLKYSTLTDRLIHICEEVQQYVVPKTGIVYSSNTPKKILSEYYKVIMKSLNVAIDLYDEIKNKDFISTTLFDLREQLKKSSNIKDFRERLTRLINNLENDNVALQVSYGNTFKLKSANIFSSGKLMLDQSKKKKIKIDNASSYGYDFIADLQIAHMLESSVKNASSMLNQLNSHILYFCKDLSVQLSFYRTGIKIIKYLESKDVKMEFPIISNTINEIVTSSLYDIGLVIKRGSSKDVISNDFKSEDNSFYLISGVNQGGKTTFLKSIGMSQLLAQNGLPVASLNYSCPVFNNLVTHFPKGEDVLQDSGKLEEELTRFRYDLPLIKNKALILMNESFATTTEKEAAEIAVDILRALSHTNSLIFFVTHNYILLKNRYKYEELFSNNKKLRSLVTIKGTSPGNRTYKIVEGEPQEEIDTIEFLKEKFIKQ